MNITRRICLFAIALCWSASLPAADVPPAEVARVALMDFSTDDNSYRSIQAAADFTDLVQLGLANEPGIEWVERTQISLAKTEFAFAEIKGASGTSPIRRGRMLGANWMVTGHFSMDDKERRTLSFQVIDLEHADVIAKGTILLVGCVAADCFGTKQVESAAAALRRLLVEAKSRAVQAEQQARLALLFLADMGESYFDKGTAVLQRELAESLRRETTTNGHVRLIEFPKAYQSTEESELVADGIIDPGQEMWKRTADLYVWGTCYITNAFSAKGSTSTLKVELHLWDGTAAPVVVNEHLDFNPREEIPMVQADALTRRLVQRVISEARVQRNKPDAPNVRKQVADSIVKTCLRKGRSGLSPLDDGNKRPFVVQMLETACFFDPDNAEARALWISCRYGWWIAFQRDLKNQFWTRFRCSEAWGNYVERFGLQPIKVTLPFPGSRDIAGPYEASLTDLVRMFPQWDSQADVDAEEGERQRGVYTALKEALGHGFPKDMPNDQAFKWKQAMKAELAERTKRVQDYALTKTNSANSLTGNFLPRSTNTAKASASNTMPPRPRPESRTAATDASEMVAPPLWLKDFMAIQRMFLLSPPRVLPEAIKPALQVVEFPSHVGVIAIRQLAFRDGQLWILAMNQSTASSSDSKPDFSDELNLKRNQLWRLDSGGGKPELYEPASMPEGVNCFLLHDQQLWLAGGSLSVWDLKQRTLRKLGLAEGVGMREIEAIARAGDRIFVAADSFELASGTASASQWTKFRPPEGWGLSHGSDFPYVLSANEQAIGYVAGDLFFQDLKAMTWTNVPAVRGPRCLAADGTTFWIGSDNGLHTYDSRSYELRSWNPPAVVGSPMVQLGFMGINYSGKMPQKQIADVADEICSRLRKLAKAGQQAYLAARREGKFTDPFQISSRIPGAVRAMLNDGDYLWVASENDLGSQLLLIHKPSHSLAASVMLKSRGIVSLALSGDQIWVGARYGEHALFSLSKDAILAVPQSRWRNLFVTAEERVALLKTMSPREQALYAFLVGDAQQAAQMLDSLNPTKISLEEMILLALSHDALGFDDATRAEAAFNQIINRFPDTPWARFAQEQLVENQQRLQPEKRAAEHLARFDKNKDGELDDSERRTMEADADFKREQAKDDSERLAFELGPIMKRFDISKDGKLDRTELDRMKSKADLFATAPKEMLAGRKNSFGPLLTDHFPATEDILRKYDRDKDGCLNLDELQSLAAEIQGKR